MNQQQFMSLLKRTWNEYLNDDVERSDQNFERIQKKDTKLDSFLSKFIYLYRKNYFTSCPEFSDLTSVGNILSRQFLTDVHAVCSRCSGSNDDIAPLIHYLLEGRGWKILWLIKFVGVETLSCNRELANLLLSLFPLCTQFPLTVENDSFSQLPDEAILEDIEFYFHLYLKNKTQHLSLRKKITVNRLRVRLKESLKSSPNDSGTSATLSCVTFEHLNSSESEAIEREQHESKKQLVHFKLNPVDFMYFTKVGAKSSDDIECYETNGSAIDFDVSASTNESMSSLGFCKSVINLLQNICQGDDLLGNALGVPVSAHILPFAINMLANINNGTTFSDPCSLLDMYRAKQQMLRLVFTSTAALAPLPDGLYFLEQSSVVPSLLCVVEEISSLLSSDVAANLNVKNELSLLALNVTYSCLLIVCIIIEESIAKKNFTCLQKVVKIIDQRRSVIGCGITKHEFCLSSDEKHQYVVRLNRLIHVIAKMLTSLKHDRACRWHKQQCCKRRHRQCDVFSSSHHHAHSVEAECCSISCLISLMLEIYSASYDASTQMIILTSLRKTGLCCCLDVETVYEKLLECLPRQTPFLCQVVLNFIETTFLQQLGGTAVKNLCHLCQRKEEVILTFVEDVKFMLEEKHTLSVQNLLALTSSHSTAWEAVCFYSKLLFGSNVVLVHQIEKHLVQMCSLGNQMVRSELLMRILLPLMLSLKCDEINMWISCLSSLCFVLKHSVLCNVFLDSGSLEILYQHLDNDTLRPLVLKVINILIVSEIDRQHNPKTICEEELNYWFASIDSLSSIKKFQTLLIEHNNKFSETLEWFTKASLADVDVRQEELMQNLEYETDLWRMCSNLVIKCSTFKKYFTLGITIEQAYQTLLKVFVSFSHQNFSQVLDETKQFGKKYLKSNICLLESLLTICLHCTPFILQTENENIDLSYLVYKMKTEVQHLVHWDAFGIKLLMEMFLRIAMGKSCARLSMQSILEDFFPACDEVDSAIHEVDDNGYVFELLSNESDDGYEADVEFTDAFKSTAFDQDRSLAHSVDKLIYPDISYLVLQLLSQMSQQFHVEKCKDFVAEVRILSSLMKRLATLCKDNVQNCFILHQQNILRIILKDYAYVFAETNPELSELQSNLLEIFDIITQYVIKTEELELFVKLFQHNEAPWECLVSSMCQLILRIKNQPSFILNFEPKDERKDQLIANYFPHLNSYSSTDWKLRSQAHISSKFDHISLEKIYNLSLLLHTQHCESKFLSAWSNAVAVLPVLSSGFNMEPSFSVSLWFGLSSLSKSGLNSNTCPRLCTSDGSIAESELFNMSFETCLDNTDVLDASSCNEEKGYHNSNSNIHLLSVGCDSVLFEIWLNAVTYKIMLRITSASSHTYSILSEVLCSTVIQTNSWHHLTVSYSAIQKLDPVAYKVSVIVDGTDVATENLECASSTKRHAINSVLVGHKSLSSSLFDAKTYLGNVALFRGDVLTQDISLCMYCMGPNCCSFLSSLIEENIVIPPYVFSEFQNRSLDVSILTNAFNSSMRSLQDAIVLFYSPRECDSVNLYSLVNIDTTGFKNSSSETLFKPSVRRGSHDNVQSPLLQNPVDVGVKWLNQAQQLIHHNLNVKFAQLGDTSMLFLLLARVIGYSNSAKAQALAVKLYLYYTGINPENRSDFISSDGPSQFTKLLSFSTCLMTSEMFKVIMDACLSRPVLHETHNSKDLAMEELSKAVVVDPEVFTAVVCNLKIWKKDENIAQLMLKITIALADETHQYFKFNLQQLRTQLFHTKLLTYCKEWFVQEGNKLQFEETAHLLVSVFKIFVGSKPDDLDLLTDLCYFLILAQPNAKSLIVYSSQSFYFNIAPTPAVVSVSKSSAVSTDDGEASADNLEGNQERSMEVDVENQSVSVDSNKLTKALENLKIQHESKISEDNSISKTDDANNKIENVTDELSESKAYEDGDDVIMSDSNLDGNSKLDFDTCTNNEDLEKEKIELESGDSFNNGEKEVSDVETTSPEIISIATESCSSEDWEILSIKEGNDVLDDAGNTFSTIRADLLLMLSCIIQDLSSDFGHQIFQKFLKPEVLLVLANSSDSGIRAAVIKLLNLYLEVTTEEERQLFIRNRGFYLLGTQLHQYPATEEICNRCFSILLGQTFTFEEQHCLPKKKLNAIQRASITLILSVLPNTMHDIALCHNVLSALLQLCEEIPTFFGLLVNHSFVETLLKLLISVVHSSPKEIDVINCTELDIVVCDIKIFFHRIITLSLSGSGKIHYHAANELLTLLSYIERREECFDDSASRSRIRDMKCYCLQSALDCLFDIASRYQKSDAIKLNGKDDSSNITPNLNERFRFILTKALDFIIHPEISNHEIIMSCYEKSFIRFLTQFMVQVMDATLKKQKRRTDHSLWNSVAWGIRDKVRLLLARLLTYLLSPAQQLEQRLFVIRVMLKEEHLLCILKMIIHACPEAEHDFSIYLQQLLYGNYPNMTEQDRKDCADLSDKLVAINVFGLTYASSRKDWATLIETSRLSWFENSVKRRLQWIKENETLEQRTVAKNDGLVKSITESAKTLMQSAAEEQSLVKKMYLNVMKCVQCEQLMIYQNWERIISQLTHEKAVWNVESSYPQSWELDSTESPTRERRRLQRCHLTIAKRFFQSSQNDTVPVNHSESSLFSFLFDDDHCINSSVFIDHFRMKDNIVSTYGCIIIAPGCETSGEILVGNIRLYFVGEGKDAKNVTNAKIDNSPVVSLSWSYEEIKEVLNRRFELVDNALEIFLTNGKTYLIAFNVKQERRVFYDLLMSKNLPNLVESRDLQFYTQLWQDRKLNNFDYLMQLNKLAGRSFNDLMQYPVFPYVLANYVSPELTLNDPAIYRNLSRPMAVQDKSKEEHYINNYNYIVRAQKDGVITEDLMPVMGPYHYGSHYSNSGTVLHFLVRLPPFTQIFLQYQDNNFDIPDRTFHSIQTSWRLSSHDSNTDLKELIPEFFYLPEFLINTEGFNLGQRQTGEIVDDVTLPPWCCNNPRLFTLVNRQALESDHITKCLHNWIDLIFGYKQIGKPAVEAINLFHPATYYGFNGGQVEDPIRREAIRTMIKTFGQTPRMMFSSPHPMILMELDGHNKQLTSNVQTVLPNIKGLKWGNYVGSPDNNEPVPIWHSDHQPPIRSFVALVTNDVFGVAENCCLALNYSKEKGANHMNIMYVKTVTLITWGHADGNIRIKKRKDQIPTLLLQGNAADLVCCCASIPDCSLLFIGHMSGIINVYKMVYESTDLRVEKTNISLIGHHAPISAIYICQAYSIILTTSLDGFCLLWDLNSLEYIRFVSTNCNAIQLVSMSNTSGDFTLVTENEVGSCLQLFSINAREIKRITTQFMIHSVSFSCAPEGSSVNIVATGMTNGAIWLWSAWDLKAVGMIITEVVSPIVCLAYSADAQHLYASNEQGILYVWSNSGQRKKGKPPKYHSLY